MWTDKGFTCSSSSESASTKREGHPRQIKLTALRHLILKLTPPPPTPLRPSKRSVSAKTRLRLQAITGSPEAYRERDSGYESEWIARKNAIDPRLLQRVEVERKAQENWGIDPASSRRFHPLDCLAENINFFQFAVL